MIKLDSEEAKKQPAIIGYLADIDKISRGNVVDGAKLFSPEFQKYHDNLIIARKTEPCGDYLFVYCGATNTQAYGLDLTGRLFTQADFGEMATFFKSVDDVILHDKKTLFLSGEFDWQDRPDAINWYRVARPMIHEDKVSDVLSFVCYDKF